MVRGGVARVCPGATFRYVEHDRGRCSRKLVGQMAAATSKRLDDAVGHDQEVQCQVIDVEPFVVELHAFPSVPPASTLLAFSGTGTGTGTRTGRANSGTRTRPVTPPNSWRESLRSWRLGGSLLFKSANTSLFCALLDFDNGIHYL
jgi:hypothetical protein